MAAQPMGKGAIGHLVVDSKFITYIKENSTGLIGQPIKLVLKNNK